ncbi:MAG: ABC transporter permease [Lachnospiraceae bacterium]|nr:ABC transporter permease [Lachnospiraceae bacterium]
MVEDIKLSFKGIWAHRMRSFLTMLGIIVGVAAVIAVVSTITGTNEQIKNNLIGDGTNTVTIQLYRNGWPADFSYSDVPEGIPELNEKVRKDILDMDHVVNVSLIHMHTYVDSLYYHGHQLSGGQVFGIDENYFETAGYHVVLGRGFSTADFKDQRKIAIIDDTLKNSVFGGENPLGKSIDIVGEPFVVVGVVNKKSEFEPVINTVEDYYMYNDYSSGVLYIPDSMWPLVFRYDEPKQVIVKADSTDTMTEVGNQCKEILNATLTSTDQTIKYESTDLAESASQLQQLSSSANILLIGIASISLLVGGIGVMNIMLVSVTERTREIGIKKALGARKNRILRQFLMEAVILSGIGGILGVVTGIVLSKIISLVALIPTAINPYAIIIAVLFSMVIGVVFGMVPSIKASKLNPIEALRYE